MTTNDGLVFRENDCCIDHSCGGKLVFREVKQAGLEGWALCCSTYFKTKCNAGVFDSPGIGIRTRPSDVRPDHPAIYRRDDFGGPESGGPPNDQDNKPRQPAASKKRVDFTKFIEDDNEPPSKFF